MVLHEDSHDTFRFADDRVIPRCHLNGVPPRTLVAVYRIDLVTEGRRELLTTAAAGEGGWVDHPEWLRVRPGTPSWPCPARRWVAGGGLGPAAAAAPQAGTTADSIARPPGRHPARRLPKPQDRVYEA